MNFVSTSQMNSLQVEVELNLKLICSWIHKCALYQYMVVHADVFFLCEPYPHDLPFQGQQQQQSAITPPVSSTGVWRLAALSVTVCLDVSLCPTHTHIYTHMHIHYHTERALQLVTGCFSQFAASLFNTQLSIQLLSSLISSPASKLRYALFKNRPTAESGP